MRPPNVGAPGPVTAGQAQDVTTADPAIVADLDEARKFFTTLAAKAAINGASLYELAGGKYLLCKYGLSRELDSLHAVAKLLAQMTGSRA